ncbi:MAG: 50S ribosomal protein L21 [Treponema sp.]|jgi:large subunit ribosomal protein L21|nr:50S ribosomal protein L21 [Treponema sp.]
MYVLIKFKGKQYRAEEGELLKVDYIKDVEIGASIDIAEVLLVSGETVKIGTPYVAGVKVLTKVQEHGKDKKIIVFKYIPKKDHRRTQGHRQPYSVLKVESIVGL